MDSSLTEYFTPHSLQSQGQREAGPDLTEMNHFAGNNRDDLLWLSGLLRTGTFIPVPALLCSVLEMVELLQYWPVSVLLHHATTLLLNALRS